MADIRAFRAFRYDLGRVGALSDVVAPPYDVIDSSLQQALYERSPFNVIRLELNKELPTDNQTENRYSRAARFLREWQTDGALNQDSARSLYVYHQELEVEGQKHIRKGFFARVRLEPFGQGKIFPHEETMAGPKADRLKLLEATGMNLSPVFGLYPDAGNAVQAQLDSLIARSLPLEATDHLGVVSRLWPVTDQHVVSNIIGLMGPRPIFIADGHHRYETGLRYLEKRKAAGEVANDEAAPNFILMMLVAMSDPGLLILPTHRLVSGLSGLSAERLQGLLAPYFDVQLHGQDLDASRTTWESLQSDGGQNVLGFGTLKDGKWLSARLKSSGPMARLAAAHSPAWRGLAVSILHVLVLGELLAKESGYQPHCQYVHLLGEVVSGLADKKCDLAVLVPPTTMSHVEEIAGRLEKMPPKSTYFYPKLLSGLVFNSVKR
ncbi:MAG: DUF1015 domain-containing protein [Gemmataceae bacterium]